MLLDASPKLSLTSLGLGLLSVACIVRFLYTVWDRYFSNAPPFPPGPKPLPIIGNIHQLPTEEQHRTFSEWGRQFGSVIHAKLFHSHVVVVNSADVARDLMEKRGGNYNDRPPFVLFSELMGWESTLTHLRFGERFRKHRKWMQSAFMNRPALNSYKPLQRRERNVMLASFLFDPDDYARHFHRFAAAALMEITYGHRVVSESDLYVYQADRAATETVKAGSPARMLVDFFPILKYYPTWLPGSDFKKDALYVRGLVNDMMDTPYEMVKRKLESGTAWPSFTGNLIEEHGRRGALAYMDEVDIKGAAGTVYAAGTETTATVMITWVLAMVRHPEVYRKAQEEIDRVVGRDRLPDFDDRDSLPYLNAIIKEVYRWHVPVPGGLPHYSMKDDVYNGYRIPGSTMIIANIWGMSQNETLYPEPEVFRPERFIDNPDDEAMDPKNIIFGFGRRLCPGKDFADTNIFFLTANIIATMDLTRARDQQGQEIVPPLDFTSGFVSRPKPFKCVFSPRSPRAVELIKQSSDA